MVMHKEPTSAPLLHDIGGYALAPNRDPATHSSDGLFANNPRGVAFDGYADIIYLDFGGTTHNKDASPALHDILITHNQAAQGMCTAYGI